MFWQPHFHSYIPNYSDSFLLKCYHLPIFISLAEYNNSWNFEKTKIAYQRARYEWLLMSILLKHPTHPFKE